MLRMSRRVRLWCTVPVHFWRRQAWRSNRRSSRVGTISKTLCIVEAMLGRSWSVGSSEAVLLAQT
jgi:hypothetical protein